MRLIPRAALLAMLEHYELRLEEKGYVSSWRGSPTPERGGRSKRFFKVRTLGKAALRNSASIRVAMAAGLKSPLR